MSSHGSPVWEVGGSFSYGYANLKFYRVRVNRPSTILWDAEILCQVLGYQGETVPSKLRRFLLTKLQSELAHPKPQRIQLGKQSIKVLLVTTDELLKLLRLNDSDDGPAPITYIPTGAEVDMALSRISQLTNSNHLGQTRTRKAFSQLQPNTRSEREQDLWEAVRTLAGAGDCDEKEGMNEAALLVRYLLETHPTLFRIVLDLSPPLQDISNKRLKDLIQPVVNSVLVKTMRYCNISQTIVFKYLREYCTALVPIIGFNPIPHCAAIIHSEEFEKEYCSYDRFEKSVVLKDFVQEINQLWDTFPTTADKLYPVSSGLILLLGGDSRLRGCPKTTQVAKLVPGLPEGGRVTVEQLDSLALASYLSNSPKSLYVIRRYDGKDSQVNLFKNCGNIYELMRQVLKEGSFGQHDLTFVGMIGK